MSGIVRGIKKVVKGAARFVRRYWKPIVAIAAIVFTAGIATVGVAGFTAAGGGAGFASTLGAIGKTMVAGVQAIGGTLGIGQGANLAGFGGQGMATLGSGAAAQALGAAAPAGLQTAAQANAAAAAAGGGASYLPSTILANAGAGAAAPAATTAATGGGWYGAMTPNVGAFAPAAANAASAAAPFGGALNSPFGQLMTSAGLGFMNSYMQGRAMEEQAERDRRGFWGVPLNRDAGPGMSIQPGREPQPMWSADSFNRQPRRLMAANPQQPNDPSTEEWDQAGGYFGPQAGFGRA